MSEADGDERGPVAIPAKLAKCRVLSVGLAGVDAIAQVERFPQPDSKVRTTSLQLMGGGNAANATTALRRLGVPCTLLSKLGDDAYGRDALRELQQEGIDTRLVRVSARTNTTFTYVIVDATEKTRSCISTAAREQLVESEACAEILHAVCGAEV